ncbi:hypothetical protein ccbrp13_69010 [Ktedonobacteria bacterium brp13]|nr:hypothetical protein ccbrp13_69010 [Ktedonobacteria bacterium brp13]
MLAIQALQGDTHRGGRSVSVLVWHSGFRLLYKPRSLAVDQQFQTLLQWVNQYNEYFDFKTYRVLDKEHYGWNESISNSHCETLAAVERFYLRQGGYLALLYALDATGGIDISGLGAQPGQLSSVALPTWGAVGTDQMQMRRERVVLNLGHNRATLQGKHVDTLTYRDVIVQGFELVYSLLLQHRVAFLQEALTLFGQDEVRCLLRPTRTYELLLNNSYHPDNLRNALERDRFFDNLWSEVVARPYLSRCIAAECADMRGCDIPLFTAYVHSRDLVTSRGERIKDFFKKSSLVLEGAESGVYHAYVQQRAQCLLQSIHEQGWITAAPQGVETPGLLFGLAGIGYELLRLAMPENIPSVLSFAAPGQRLF